MSTYTVAEAKSKFSELLAGVEAGRVHVITKRGKPIAHVVPVAEARSRPPFDIAGLKAFVESLPDPADNADEALARWKEHERY